MTSLQTNFFDYAALDTETRIVVQQEDKEYDHNMGEAGISFLRACHNQKRINDALRYKHPGYVDYVDSKPGLKRATAYRMIEVAKMFPESGNIYIDSKEALYLLASPNTPESVRTEAIARAEQGESITYSAARELIEEAQETRRYDGFAQVVPRHEPQIEYAPPVEYIPAPITPRAQQFGVMVSSETNEWYTPADIIALARTVLGAIDLDPASCADANLTVDATDYYDQDRNGLAQPWEGRVWLNPPYGKTGGRSNQDIWAEKLIAEYEGGNCTAAILLVKAALGYAWFERLWYAYPTCFVRERLYFTPGDGSEDGQAKAATAIMYVGPDVAKFKAVFSAIGRVILPED